MVFEFPRIIVQSSNPGTSVEGRSDEEGRVYFRDTRYTSRSDRSGDVDTNDYLSLRFLGTRVLRPRGSSLASVG